MSQICGETVDKYKKKYVEKQFLATLSRLHKTTIKYTKLQSSIQNYNRLLHSLALTLSQMASSMSSPIYYVSALRPFNKRSFLSSSLTSPTVLRRTSPPNIRLPASLSSNLWSGKRRRYLCGDGVIVRAEDRVGNSSTSPQIKVF